MCLKSPVPSEYVHRDGLRPLQMYDVGREDIQGFRQKIVFSSSDTCRGAMDEFMASVSRQASSFTAIFNRHFSDFNLLWVELGNVLEGVDTSCDSKADLRSQQGSPTRRVYTLSIRTLC